MNVDNFFLGILLLSHPSQKNMCVLFCLLNTEERWVEYKAGRVDLKKIVIKPLTYRYLCLIGVI